MLDLKLLHLLWLKAGALSEADLLPSPVHTRRCWPSGACFRMRQGPFTLELRATDGESRLPTVEHQGVTYVVGQAGQVGVVGPQQRCHGQAPDRSVPSQGYTIWAAATSSAFSSPDTELKVRLCSKCFSRSTGHCAFEQTARRCLHA